MSKRRSLGGSIVDRSLEAVGFVLPENVQLVETADPRIAYRVLLAQSAWHVVDQRKFRSLLAPYPKRMAAIAVARRALALWNLRRATKVVCLTHAMGEMVERATHRKVEVVPVTAPIHDWDGSDFLGNAPSGVVCESGMESFALVVGTLTWYKRPQAALEYFARARDVTSASLMFLGRDDGSGCWPYVRRRAESLQVQVERREVDHASLPQYYRAARITLLPSGLESLGFALSEALLLGVPVMASPIAAHREVAQRAGGETLRWWATNGQVSGERIAGAPLHEGDRARITYETARAEWERLSNSLSQ